MRRIMDGQANRERIRLLLLDDHVLFREGLSRLLASEPDFEMVGNCGTSAEALEVLKGSPVDIVLLDFDLGEDHGSQFIAAARRAGYAGKVLRVNLTDKTFAEEPLPVDVARDFIGGAGFTVKYLFDEVPADCDPLGPLNKLIFACGPFTGTSIPCASRMAVNAKSPATSAMGVAMTGGHFPVELKRAGYDVLIIEGVAEKPIYLWIKNGKVSFRDASDVWGMATADTQQTIKDKLGDQNVRVSCIGPAGEKLAKLACISLSV